MIYGYIHVSSDKQTVENQRFEITEFCRVNNLLMDAGEKLIHRTFIIVHDYFFDYNYTSFKQKNDDEEETVSRTLDLSKKEDVDWYNNQLYKGDLQLAKFSVSCVSYLYQLKWTEEEEAIFYQRYYTSEQNHDSQKVEAFNGDKSTFQLTYLGKYNSSVTEKNTHNYNNQTLVKKACVRLVDQNIAGLQHQFPQFRIKARLLSGADDKTFKAYIGLKEDVAPNSRFEVLEPELHEDGTYTYERVGIIQPIANKIWDNRYLATDDIETDLDATYFKQISGGELYPGLIIREMN